MKKGRFSELLTEANSPKAKGEVKEGNTRTTTPETPEADSATVVSGGGIATPGFLDNLQMPENSPEEAKPAPALPATQVSAVLSKAASPILAAANAPKGNRGRPPGKRSDAEYEQVTFFMRKETRKALRRVLLDDERFEKKDLSELVEQIVSVWLQKHKTSK